MKASSSHRFSGRAKPGFCSWGINNRVRRKNSDGTVTNDGATRQHVCSHVDLHLLYGCHRCQCRAR